MSFVRLFETRDYGKPYVSMQAAQEQARKDMSYAVSMLAGKKPKLSSASGSSKDSGKPQNAK